MSVPCVVVCPCGMHVWGCVCLCEGEHTCARWGCLCMCMFMGVWVLVAAIMVTAEPSRSPGATQIRRWVHMGAAGPSGGNRHDCVLSVNCLEQMLAARVVVRCVSVSASRPVSSAQVHSWASRLSRLTHLLAASTGRSSREPVGSGVQGTGDPAALAEPPGGRPRAQAPGADTCSRQPTDGATKCSMTLTSREQQDDS